MMNTIQIALSGMNAATKRVEASASNIANMTSGGALKPADGPAPYHPLTVTQSAMENGGVKSNTIMSPRAFTPSYAPDSPFADTNGLIGMPAIDPAEEIVTMHMAKHSYQANIQAIKTAASMQDSLLETFDKKA